MKILTCIVPQGERRKRGMPQKCEECGVRQAWCEFLRHYWWVCPTDESQGVTFVVQTVASPPLREKTLATVTAPLVIV